MNKNEMKINAMNFILELYLIINLWNFPIFPYFDNIIHNLLLDLIEKLAYNF